MSRRKPRHLSAEERALWEKVAERTTPLEKPSFGLTPPKTPLKIPAKQGKPAKQPKPPIQPFQVGSKPRGTTPLAQITAPDPIRMDRKAYTTMNRGKLKPEGRLDLHGMTMAEAHPELVHFILNAQSAGKRLVLVITGKGRTPKDDGPIPVRKGILRHQLPQWLSQAPLSQAVLQVSEAHLKHGGSGAYYVYLRRRR